MGRQEPRVVLAGRYRLRPLGVPHIPRHLAGQTTPDSPAWKPFAPFRSEPSPLTKAERRPFRVSPLQSLYVPPTWRDRRRGGVSTGGSASATLLLRPRLGLRRSARPHRRQQCQPATRLESSPGGRELLPCTGHSHSAAFAIRTSSFHIRWRRTDTARAVPATMLLRPRLGLHSRAVTARRTKG